MANKGKKMCSGCRKLFKPSNLDDGLCMGCGTDDCGTDACGTDDCDLVQEIEDLQADRSVLYNQNQVLRLRLAGLELIIQMFKQNLVNWETVSTMEREQ